MILDWYMSTWIALKICGFESQVEQLENRDRSGEIWSLFFLGVPLYRGDSLGGVLRGLLPLALLYDSD